jgi:DeoR/GlpR family transcriptional regulator of sugar metabolism
MNKRQEDILDLLSVEGEVSVRELAERFAVTSTTVRRDLDLLQREGRLVRTHGSASLSRSGVVQFAFREKGRRQLAEKRAIAAAMAPAIESGMTVALDTGTTTLEVAKLIGNLPKLTVLTTSLPIASALHSNENVELILLGGMVRRNDPDLSGPLTEQNLRQFKVDLAVLGADAVMRDGVYTMDVGIARGTQAMMQCAARRFLCVDHTKFSARALYRYAEWGEFTGIISDDAVPAATREWLEEQASSVTYAAVERKGSSGAQQLTGSR